MLGAYAVGKTSLVRQFIHSIFDEKYHSTIGVKVDEKTVSIDGQEIKLMLWDIAGAEDYFSVPMSYVRGSSGYLLVIDGTRPETLDRALDIVEQIEQTLGKLPAMVVLNKCDLTDQWQLDDAQLKKLAPLNCPVINGSAKTGEGVEEAFLEIARLTLD